MINIYKRLFSEGLPKEGFYKAETYAEYSRNRIGVDNLGYLCILVRNNNPIAKRPNIVYKNISVSFNSKCEILIEDKHFVEYFTIITLNTYHEEIQGYFLNIFIDIVSVDKGIIDLDVLYDRIINIFNLFSRASPLSKRVIQGLFAELVIILSQDTERFIKAWHIDKSSLFDFSFKNCFLEVKSTNNTDRIHRFSNSQINFLKKHRSFIASVQILESDLGSNINDIYQRISRKINDNQLRLKLDRLLLETLLNSIELSTDTKFDIDYSFESIRFYEINSIDSFDVKIIPKMISKLNYDVDLEDIKFIEFDNLFI